MKISELKKIIKAGESATLEFKASMTQLRAAMETVCAFLNSKRGGTVLIGVKDNGDIIGDDISDKTQTTIANEIHKIEPHPNLEIQYIPCGQKKVVAISVQSGLNGPYSYETRPFRRSESTTRLMAREEYNRLLSAKGPSWEELTTNDCTIADLDKNRIRQVVRVAIAEGRLGEIASKAPIHVLLKKLDLTIDDKPKNACVVLFCKKENKQFIQSMLAMARFNGIDKSEFITEKSIRGNAFDLYEAALNFLTTYLPVAARIEEGNPFRVETPAIPYKVLREALINALCHHDYSIRGGSIAVAFYDDRVNITSTGLLPEGITIRQLPKEHASVRRNPLIANIFYLCHMIERWGRGTKDMVELCKESGNPIPKFKEVAASLSVTLPLNEPIRRVEVSSPQADLLRSLTQRQKEILEVLKHKPLSREEIIEKLKSPPATRTVQLDLTQLYNLKMISKSGGKTGRFLKWSVNR